MFNEVIPNKRALLYKGIPYSKGELILAIPQMEDIYHQELAMWALAEIDRLQEALKKLHQGHYECDDCWYSCPKCEEGCCDENAGDECNCGADRVNAIIDEALGVKDHVKTS